MLDFQSASILDEDNLQANENKFIALVVSDEEEGDSRIPASPVIQYRTPSMTVSNKQNRIQRHSKAANASTPIHSEGSGRSSSGKKSTDDKVRWSFISNASSKKRWSTLTFDSKHHRSEHSEEGNAEAQKERSSFNSSSRRISITSNISANVSLERNGSSLSDKHSDMSSNAMKRSSTGLSLRQLFTKIVINDDGKSKDAKDVMITPVKSNFNQSHNRTSSMMKVNHESWHSGKERLPLQPITNIRRINEFPVNERPKSTIAMNYNRSLGTSVNVNSKDNSKDSHVARWKFWKKKESNMSKPISSNSQVFDKRDNDAHANKHYSSTPLKNTESKLGLKSSFSDLHKSLFNSSSDATSSSSFSYHVSSGLKHKSSTSSLRKLKDRRKSNNTFLIDDVSSYHSNSSSTHHISLPVPDQASREKIRNRLKSSTSLLSLNSSIAIDKKDYDESLILKILENCDIKYIHAENSSLLRDGLIPVKSNWKIGTGSSKILKVPVDDAVNPFGVPVVCKVFDLGTLDDVTYLQKSLALQELLMLRTFEGTTGFPVLLQSYVVQNKNSKGSYCNRDSVALVLFLKDHGESLKGSVEMFRSAEEALKIFWKVANILYVAESKYQFEHRNLTLDHILVDQLGNVTICDMTCSRSLDYNGQITSAMELKQFAFFQGKGDYQFEIYSMMRYLMQNNVHCSQFEPRTNTLWLHYLCMKLIEALQHKNINVDGLQNIASRIDPRTSLAGNRVPIFRNSDSTLKFTGDLLQIKPHGL